MKDTSVAGDTQDAIEEEKEAFIARVKGVYGSKGKKQALELLADTEKLFMNSNVSEDTKLALLRDFMDIFWEVKEENRRKYTRKDYRKG